MAFNPLGAVQEGYDFGQGLRDRRTMNNAGNALAGGDYRGGANALLQGGMLNEGSQLLAYDQKRQAFDAEQAQKQAEAARAQQAESMKSMLGGAQSLRQLPPEARAAAYQAQVRPLLQQMGLDEKILAHLDGSDFSDGQLDPFISTLGGELQKPEWQIVNPGNGQQAYAVDKGDPSNFRPVGPEGRQKAEVVEGPDGLYERQADGSWKQVAKFGAAPKVFAPRAPRGGGGRGRGGAPTSGSSELPPGFVLE